METELVDDGGLSPLAQINKAEIDVQIATAKRYPRSISKIQNNVLSLATLDEETAGACFFSLPRGGKVITGESVRLAEIFAASYGNLRAAWEPVHVDRVNGVVTCRGMCHDLENNVSAAVNKTRQVQRLRDQKQGDPFNEDMITLATNACGAIAYRDAIFKVVPKALLKPILGKIKEAARGKGTLDQRVDRIIKRFIELGGAERISERDMEGRVLAAVDAAKRSDINLDKLDVLIGMGTSITDGEIRLRDAFPDPKAQKKADPFVAPEGSKEGEKPEGDASDAGDQEAAKEGEQEGTGGEETSKEDSDTQGGGEKQETPPEQPPESKGAPAKKAVKKTATKKAASKPESKDPGEDAKEEQPSKPKEDLSKNPDGSDSVAGELFGDDDGERGDA